MVFKRRSRRSPIEVLAAIFYPKGGWRRAANYTLHRLRRLPDTPDRIARGIAAGVFVCFTPMFGLHFILAAMIAVMLRGNILAALIATFFGNPITFPIIISMSVELGNWALGQPPGMQLPQIAAAFGRAMAELWENALALISGAPMRWDRGEVFFFRVFLPYTIGGVVPGVITSFVIYSLALPLITAYQRNRRQALRKRFAASRTVLRVEMPAPADASSDDTDPPRDAPADDTGPPREPADDPPRRD